MLFVTTHYAYLLAYGCTSVFSTKLAEKISTQFIQMTFDVACCLKKCFRKILIISYNIKLLEIPKNIFRSSSNDHIHINDRGSKNFLQKYFAEPYFSICFFCCRSVLPSWLPEHPELPELPELPNCPNFRTAGTP